MRGPALARAQEDGCGVCCCDEPEERVDQVNPDGTLHANDTALLGRRVGIDEDLAENAKEGEPENAMVNMLVNCLTRGGSSHYHAPQTPERKTYVRIQSQAKAQYDLKNGMP